MVRPPLLLTGEPLAAALDYANSAPTEIVPDSVAR